jgi:hypothetical protein
LFENYNNNFEECHKENSINLIADLDTFFYEITNNIEMLSENNSNNNIFNNTTMSAFDKSANSDTDFSKLFRGLSTFEFDPNSISITTQKNEENSTVPNHTEKTYTDLTDLLLREQMLNNPNSQATTISQPQLQENLISLTPVKMITNAPVVDESMTQITSLTDNKSKPRLNRMSSRRSNCSIPMVTQSTRGRKPNALKAKSGEVNNKKKLSKKELLLQQAEKPVVCFGNKVVIKETAEYYKRRENNNEAVKKCREKTRVLWNDRQARVQGSNTRNQVAGTRGPRSEARGQTSETRGQGTRGRG